MKEEKAVGVRYKIKGKFLCLACLLWPRGYIAITVVRECEE